MRQSCRFALWCSWAAAVLLVCAPSAKAQTQPETQPRGGWVFVPALTFSGTADNNVLLAGEGEHPPGDYVTAFGPSGMLDYNGPRLRFSTAYLGSFVVYRDLGELNSLDQNARAGVSYRATKRVTISGSQSYSTARTTDTVELLAVPFRRIGNKVGATTAGLEARLSPRTTVKGNYALRVVSFDTSAVRFIAFPGGHEHFVSGSLDRILSRRWTMGAVTDVRRVVIAGGIEPVVLYHWAGTTEYRVSDQLSLNGSLGASRLGVVATQPARLGLAWSAGTSARFEYATVGARYERSVVPSFGFGGTFQNEELSGTARGPFARNRAYWQGAAAWRGNDPIFPGPPSRRSTWWSGTVGYLLQPWMRVEGFFTRAQQSTSDGGSINRNRLGFQVVTSKPLRLAR